MNNITEQESAPNSYNKLKRQESSVSLKLNERKDTPSYGSMFKRFLKLSIPTILQCNLMMFPNIVNTVYAGRFNDAAKLAGVGLGNTTLNILCLSIMMGMTGALETFVSQAFGYGNLVLCGVYLNRARLIGTFLFIPLMILLLFSETILLKLGQDPLTCHFA